MNDSKTIVLCLIATLLLGLPACTTTGPSQPADSEAAEKNGLAMIIHRTKSSFWSSDPLAFSFTFQNRLTTPLRLPSESVPTNYCVLKLKNEQTGKIYTGGSMLPFMTGMESVEPSPPISPGGTLSSTAVFDYFGYIADDLDFSTFRETNFQRGMSASNVSRREGTYLDQLPDGLYMVSVDIQYLSQVKPDNDPTPVWNGGSIQSNPVEILIIH